MSIRVLDDTVIDQIAAGEVIERPASVLKELIENSLDAGATRIEVRLKQGGVALIQITDDGFGMNSQDALLCIERHATSKLRSASDLVEIGTLGFRGEALPSIGSVSRMTIRTRRREDEVGTQLTVEGGKLSGVTPWAGAAGTDISVRNLFFNVPARRKFLRTKQTELSHCMENVQRVALMRPDVSFSVTHDGRKLLDAPSTTDAKTRIRDVIGDDARVLVPVSSSRGALGVRGLVGPVGVHRASSIGSVYVYVNGRHIRDRVVRRAITEAYRGVMPPGRYPLVVLAIEMPGEDVDVNVHPAKTEVRFRQPRVLVDHVTAALREALRGDAPQRLASSPSRGLPEPRETVLPLLQPVAAEPAPRVGLAAHPDDDPRLVPRRATPGVSPMEQPSGSAPVDQAEAPPVTVPPRVEAASTSAPVPERYPDRKSPPRQPVIPAAQRDTSLDARGAFVPERVLFIVEGRVAVCAADSRLFFCDLDVLQTRLLKHQLAAGSITGQPLLVPLAVDLGQREARAVIDHAEALSALGIDVSAFGPGTLAIMALPSFLPTEQPEQILTSVAHSLSSGADDLAAAVATAVCFSSRDAHEAKRLFATWREADLGELPGRWLDSDTLSAWLAKGEGHDDP